MAKAKDIVLVNDLPDSKLTSFADSLGGYGDSTRVPEAEEHREGAIYLLQDAEDTPSGDEAPAGTFRIAGLVSGVKRLPVVLLNVRRWRVLKEANNGTKVCWSNNMRTADVDVPDHRVPPLGEPQETRDPSRRCEDCPRAERVESGEYCKRRAKYLVYDPTRKRLFVLHGSSTSSYLLESVNAQLDELTTRINNAREDNARAAGLTPGTKAWLKAAEPIRTLPNTAAVMVLHSTRAEDKAKGNKWYELVVSMAPRAPKFIEDASCWPASEGEARQHGVSDDQMLPWLMPPDDAKKLALITQINDNFNTEPLVLLNLSSTVEQLNERMVALGGTPVEEPAATVEPTKPKAKPKSKQVSPKGKGKPKPKK